jgi:hypothetical protein
MSRLQGLLRFIGEAPGAVMGGLLGPSPIPPELAGQLPQGYDQQARQQAINNMSMQALSQPRGQLGNVLQGAQQGYQGSLINMLRGQEMAKAQQQADEERARIARFRQNPEVMKLLGPLAQDASDQMIEKIITDLATQQSRGAPDIEERETEKGGRLFIGSDGRWQFVPEERKAEQQTPADIQTLQWYLSRSPEEKAQIDAFKRGDPGQRGFDSTTGKWESDFIKSFPKAERAYKSTIDRSQDVIDAIDSASKNVSAFTTGIMGKEFAALPGSPQLTLRQQIETIKANIGFDRLQQMRNESPTGGALGQVAVQELIALQASMASLEQSQSPAQFARNLAIVKSRYERFQESARRGLEEDRMRAEEISRRRGYPGPVGNPTSRADSYY